MKNKYIFLITILTLVFVVYASGPRVDLNYSVKQIVLPPQLDQYIAKTEQQFDDIKPGTNKKIIWANSKSRNITPYSIVYLHGFSASRQEIAPLCDMLASNLSANLYYTRLTGHGRTSDAMRDVTVNALINDANEALEIGKRLGEKVILIGSSTGGTLATWLSAQKTGDVIAALILMSPNFGLKRKESEILLYPWGKTILHLLEGDYYQFQPVNELQEKYWTTRYHSDALLPMMGLVELVRNNTASKMGVPVLVLYAKEDNVVDVEKIKSQFRQFTSPVKSIVAISNSTDPQQHILAGDVLSPTSTEDIMKTINEFLAPVIQR